MSTSILCLLNVFALSATLTLHPIILTPPPSPRQWFQATDSSQKKASLPYISGDTFRTLATCCIDELRTPCDTNAIHDGDIIFVRSNLINYFFNEVHPHISARYILITHNEDSPAIGCCRKFLDDDQLIAWFALNVELPYRHPKLHLIPIGIANSCWPFGKIEILNDAMQKLPDISKKYMLYINFYKEETRVHRVAIEQLFIDKPWAYRRSNRPWDQYLADMAASLFVLSPHGDGLDCYRTWEALLMGSFPIVKTSSLDPLYEDLPVLIVQEWTDITEDFLIIKYHEMKKQTFKMEKIYAHYWHTMILECQKKFLDHLSC